MTLRSRSPLWSLFAALALAGCASETAPEPVGPPDALPDALADPTASPADTADASSNAWTIETTTLARETDRIVTLTGVRTAMHVEGGYDRVVFDLPDGLPEVHVEYVDKPVRACGSGEQIWPEGDGYLQIRMSGARAHTEDGETTAPHERQSVGLPNLRETVPTCDFEGEVTWVLGVASPEPYRVLTLEDPARLAVDVRHLSAE